MPTTPYMFLMPILYSACETKVYPLAGNAVGLPSLVPASLACFGSACLLSGLLEPLLLPEPEDKRSVRQTHKTVQGSLQSKSKTARLVKIKGQHVLHPTVSFQ